MSANQIHRPRVLKGEGKSRTAPPMAAGTMIARTPLAGAEGLTKPGYPHGLALPGIMPAGVSRTEAEGSFAGGTDPDEPHKGKNLDLYA